MARRLLQVMVEDELLDRITDWRHDRRFATRSAAVRKLLERGLGSEPRREGTSSVAAKPDRG